LRHGTTIFRANKNVAYNKTYIRIVSKPRLKIHDATKMKLYVKQDNNIKKALSQNTTNWQNGYSLSVVRLAVNAVVLDEAGRLSVQCQLAHAAA
jgi:hypothetical protein